MTDKQKSHEYLMGYDCGLHGANMTNCYFGLFSTPEKTKQWEEGKKAGENKKNEIIKKLISHDRQTVNRSN